MKNIKSEAEMQKILIDKILDSAKTIDEYKPEFGYVLKDSKYSDSNKYKLTLKDNYDCESISIS